VAWGLAVNQVAAGSTPALTASARRRTVAGLLNRRRGFDTLRAHDSPPTDSAVRLRSDLAAVRLCQERPQRRVRLMAGPLVLSQMTGVRFSHASPRSHWCAPSDGLGADATNVGWRSSTLLGGTTAARSGRARRSHKAHGDGSTPSAATSARFAQWQGLSPTKR
jgi:hypothetical protein